MKDEKRCQELSGKFLQMGDSLMQEGTDAGDYNVAQAGTLLILLSSLVLSDRDMFIFSELSSMFVAKKILDEREKVNPVEGEVFAKILADINAEKAAAKEVPKRKTRRKRNTDNPEGQ